MTDRRTRKQFRALGRDLYFDTECSCPDPKWIGSTVAHLFKNRVRLCAGPHRGDGGAATGLP